MKKIHIAIVASLLAGFAVAAVTLQAIERPPEPAASPDAAAHFDQSADTEARIRALEAAVAEERNARQLLEEELLVLFDELDALRAPESETVEPQQPDAEQAALLARAQESRERGRRLSSSEGRFEALVEAGFSPDRAAWIQRREDELRLEAMQARFDAQRSGDMQAMFAAGSFSESSLRDELGDAQYEQYLDAFGRSTTVRIGSVIESSPGQLAGLQTGDEIVRYDGRRVFNYGDINNQQLQGEPGQSIVVDIVRDGTPMQIVMPRGPIGIQAGRSRRR